MSNLFPSPFKFNQKMFHLFLRLRLRLMKSQIICSFSHGTCIGMAIALLRLLYRSVVEELQIVRLRRGHFQLCGKPVVRDVNQRAPDGLEASCNEGHASGIRVQVPHLGVDTACNSIL